VADAATAALVLANTKRLLARDGLRDRPWPRRNEQRRTAARPGRRIFACEPPWPDSGSHQC
jgi:hypothetical protein